MLARCDSVTDPVAILFGYNHNGNTTPIQRRSGPMDYSISFGTDWASHQFLFEFLFEDAKQLVTASDSPYSTLNIYVYKTISRPRSAQ
jgi:hypothetical protein